ncbi:hypothetical protein TVAG_390430 [Trichomonas vaginalis G3]|uniref:GRIP domain-containing protein n=1 Tax=Trichomonas vaginalis (strain ATCC PRA-98 / G3) TaxID=412133 RepID=A2ESU7_TRIV3|nr:biological adhesion protein [Trichomonas vaginalis G3]EAY04273.1 hypothetical protein TVAG_390430 [Trichomonas vaginalis G3]KAI5549366.1 biological adhesion protein [Trichomonas vaginalis G3]|eukprot:XP_001316496.1 hypothetical protein [Trichomonas vaginalis G3]
MKLTEAIINEINEIPKLKYLLINLMHKNEKVSADFKVIQKQLASLQQKYDSLQNDYEILSKTSQNLQSNQGDVEFERIRADFNQNACEFLTRLIRGVDHSDPVSSSTKLIDEFRSEIKLSIDSQKLSIQKELSDQTKFLKEKTALINEMRDQLNRPISQDVEKLLNEKDESITKYKSMLQRSVKSDQRNQEQISVLQSEVNRLNELLSQNSSPQSQSAPVEEVTKLQLVITSLEERIRNSAPSKELEAKYDRLQAMFEKSNRIYSQLDEKYQNLLKSMNQKKFYSIIEESLVVEVPDVTTMERKATKKDPKPKSQKMSGAEALIASLRKTILQYFLCKDDSQADLVPVILEIVGCTPEQIATVERNQEARRHLINKTGAFFGIFG